MRLPVAVFVELDRILVLRLILRDIDAPRAIVLVVFDRVHLLA